MTMRRTKKTAGFIVPMAAALSLLIALLMVGALEFVRHQTRDMAFIRDRAEAMPTLRSTLNLTALMLRVVRSDATGFAPDEVVGRKLMGIKEARIWIDGTPFVATVEGRAMTIRIRDEAGLPGLNSLAPEELERFLTMSGLPFPVAQKFAAEAADFRDMDDERRSNGAERDDYRRNKLAGPKNGSFNYSGELGQLLSAAVFRRAWSGGLLLDLGFDRSPQININAASPVLLVSAFGFSEASAARFVQERKTRVLEQSDLTRFSHRTSAMLEHRMSNGGSNRYRLELTDNKSGAKLRRTIIRNAENASSNLRSMLQAKVPQQRPGPVYKLDGEITDLN